VRFAVLLLLLVFQVGSALAHALQPGFLDLRALGGDNWRVMWKVPELPLGPMPISAVLPQNCDVRSRDERQYDGAAFVTDWLAHCQGGIQGGEIRIEGLELTETDVLVRAEVAPGAVEIRRLTAATPSFVLPAPRGLYGTFATYVPLGIDHILRGVDHLMFVFGLILMIPDRRRLVGAVTAFTVAHSISLALVSLGWIVVPASPVDAVVALSIMFLAIELLRDPDSPRTFAERYPWIIAFAFGLLHGLGFARALLDIGLPRGEIPGTLVSFNLGVEIGQLLFIALVIVVGALLARLYPAMGLRRRDAPLFRPVAYALGGIAAFWFVERLAAF